MDIPLVTSAARPLQIFYTIAESRWWR